MEAAAGVTLDQGVPIPVATATAILDGEVTPAAAPITTEDMEAAAALAAMEMEIVSMIDV